MYARSQTEREGSKVSEGLSEQGIPLMTAQQIMQMRDEDILAFHRSLLPIKVRRMDWRNIPELTKRHNLTPPKLQVLRLKEEEPQPILGTSPKKSSYLDPIDPDALSCDPGGTTFDD
jgi:type IV secretory pathway TraG/TraD family ATPase VirD4